MWEWDNYFTAHTEIVKTLLIITFLINMEKTDENLIGVAIVGAAFFKINSNYMEGFILFLVLLVLMYPNNFSLFFTFNNKLPLVLSILGFGTYTAGIYKASIYDRSDFYRDV